MKSTSLSNFMLHDHAIMHGLFKTIEKNIEKDAESLLKSIDEFEWKIKKHYFVEEKAIFTAYEPEDVNEGYAMVPKVLKQHDEILKKLKIFKKSIKKKKAFDFQGFKEMLKNHKNFEEGNLYPRLEQELPESEKKLIIKRINEIL
ncbi:MAG: hemerythrin domain-containing protein [Thermoplasmatales archaeon]|nr:MAG: hemerythrin domain-containing protein [Thermoplasmatales archaeon]